MRGERKLKIALLTHSTNPRGGVVHALELGDALHDLGHDAVVHAPDHRRDGFYRTTRCRTALVPARPVSGGLAALIGARIEDYIGHFSREGAEGFDVYHAQDGISANALATLTERGLIPGYVRTVHHLDDFSDPRVAHWQRRGVSTARRVLCVSRLWHDILRRDHGIAAVQVPNGVDTRRFSPIGDDAAVRERLGIAGSPVFLAIGGIEARKNTLRLLQAFLRVLGLRPWAQLVIAGGASLLDHQAYRAEFEAAVEASGLEVGPGRSLVLTGPLADQDMPALYRCADALIFPSITEGFGLVVLEAMASGTPVVVSRIAPFTEYLGQSDCLWVDPLDVDSIATAMFTAGEAKGACRFRSAGLRVSRRYPWVESARRHVGVYSAMARVGERDRMRRPAALAAAACPSRQ